MCCCCRSLLAAASRWGRVLGWGSDDWIHTHTHARAAACSCCCRCRWGRCLLCSCCRGGRWWVMGCVVSQWVHVTGAESDTHPPRRVYAPAHHSSSIGRRTDQLALIKAARPTTITRTRQHNKGVWACGCVGVAHAPIRGMSIHTKGKGATRRRSSIFASVVALTPKGKSQTNPRRRRRPPQPPRPKGQSSRAAPVWGVWLCWVGVSIGA